MLRLANMSKTWYLGPHVKWPIMFSVKHKHVSILPLKMNLGCVYKA